MKNIVKILLIFHLCFLNLIHADFTVCDSGNINLSGISINEICNGGYMTGSIIGIDSFTGKFINIEMGYWGTKNNYNNNINVEENLPFGYFDSNKQIKITKTNPKNDTTIIGYWGTKNNYNNDINVEENLPFGYFDGNKQIKITKINPNNDTTIIGYWGTKNNYNNNINVEENLPFGYFDGNIKIKILNITPDFDTPVGFLGSYVLPKKSGSKKKLVIKQDTYRGFFKKIFSGGNSRYDYNIFINNILDLLIDGNKFQNNIIDDIAIARINLYIKNSEFQKRLDKLSKNYIEINNAFEKTKNREEKFYILKYFLNE